MITYTINVIMGIIRLGSIREKAPAGCGGFIARVLIGKGVYPTTSCPPS
jgi:hypothetical protein